MTSGSPSLEIKTQLLRNYRGCLFPNNQSSAISVGSHIWRTNGQVYRQLRIPRTYRQFSVSVCRTHSNFGRPLHLCVSVSWHMYPYDQCHMERSGKHWMPRSSHSVSNPLFENLVVFWRVIDVFQIGIVMVNRCCCWSSRKRWMCFWNFRPERNHPSNDLAKLFVSPDQRSNISRVRQKSCVEIGSGINVVCVSNMYRTTSFRIMIPESGIDKVTFCRFSTCIISEPTVSSTPSIASDYMAAIAVLIVALSGFGS